MAAIVPALAGQSSGRPGPAWVEAEETIVFKPAEPGRAAERGSERRLIRQAQDGSADAVEALFRRYWPRAYRAAYVVCHDANAAEDIAQEAFLAALRSLHRFDRRRPFGPWLHRIAINRAIDWTRARSLRGEVLGVTESETYRPLDSLEDPRAERLAEALAGLSADHRAVVAMRFVYDWTPGEISRALGIPRGTVNSRLRRALDALAGEMEDRR